MTGWLADFFRFWWALAYWNGRKAWFRLNGAHRDACPCQTFSDSGHALDSRCEAVATWHRPGRFRRVCPLLTETKDGWRCGVDAERVRPFWGRALGYTGAALLALYLAGTVALYATLRASHYPVAYVQVVWPPRWPELRQSQERLYLNRAQHALDTGDFPTAMLALQTVCELNPRNHAAGLTLARLKELSGQPYVAQHIYERLMQDVPEQRAATAQVWIRTLLARGDYATIKPLATSMLSEDSGHRAAWLHALLFAARQSADPQALAAVLAADHGLPDWCTEILRGEQLLLQNRPDQALAVLRRTPPRDAPGYFPTFQADRLLRAGYPDLAAASLETNAGRVPADEAAFLRLRVFQAKAWDSLIETEVDNLLHLPLTPRLATLFCAYLAEPRQAGIAPRFLQRFAAAGPAISEESLPVYQAVYLVAAAGGDPAQADQIAAAIKSLTGSDAKALHELGSLLKARAPAGEVAQFLPLVPLPLEMVYAILERPTPAR